MENLSAYDIAAVWVTVGCMVFAVILSVICLVHHMKDEGRRFRVMDQLYTRRHLRHSNREWKKAFKSL